MKELKIGTLNEKKVKCYSIVCKYADIMKSGRKEKLIKPIENKWRFICQSWWIIWS